VCQKRLRLSWKVDECKPLPEKATAAAIGAPSNPNRQYSAVVPADWQGLTLVHFSAQLERFVWDRGCA